VPTRVLIEGPEIEPLLAQIREEYGPDARIVSADKVRSGGVAGFFSKQHYEIAVEVEDGQAPPTSAASPVPAVPSASTTKLTAVDTTPGSAAVTLLDLVEARRDRFEATDDVTGLPPRAGLISTSGSSFADVMAGLRAEGLATTTRPETGAVPAPATQHQDAQAGAAAADPGAEVTTLVRPYRPAVVAPGTAAVVPAVPATADPTPPSAAADPPPPPATVDTRAAAPAVHAAPAVDAAPRPTPATNGEPSAPWAAGLLTLGLPAPLATKAHGSDPYQAVLHAFAEVRPPSAPARPGDILVLVGDVGRALPIGQRVAEGLRLEPGSILLAAATAHGTTVGSSGRISGPADAERRARRMHRADTPHVVVVDAPIDDTDPEWVRDVCDALGATGVWAVVDATRKTADTARHLSGFGKVDAVAAYAVRACGDPASVLRIGPPVALLDGAPATSHAWAALLSERLLSTVEASHGSG
jgi:hypothetical protein